jgi:hypothetical protein
VNSAALTAFADAAEAFARAARALAKGDSAVDPDEQLTLADAARIAKTTVGVLKEGIRRKNLTAYGGQRDRSVRRGDLMSWIESRRTRPPEGPDDDDVSRRMRRLSQKNR